MQDFHEVDTGSPVVGFNGVRDTAEFKNLNPNALIPVMVDGDLVLFESMAICQYIAKKFGGSLSGQNEAEDAQICMFGQWSMTDFGTCLKHSIHNEYTFFSLLQPERKRLYVGYMYTY